MLLVKYTDMDLSDFVTKYNSNVVELMPEKSSNDWLILLMAKVKLYMKDKDVVILDYFDEVFVSLNTLNVSYVLVYPKTLSEQNYLQHKAECDAFNEFMNWDENVVSVDGVAEFEKYMSSMFDWIQIDTEPEADTEVNDLVAGTTEVPLKKNSELSMEELLKDDVVITEADIRDLKSMSNKFKVAMMLQAKSRLNTILSLCNTMDKLYAELVRRIDNSIETTDTASLMYTADYISKAISETNQFIMSLITNEKIQNFFIIDNSNVININNDDRVALDKREKIRKAAEIVMDNIDLFASGHYGDMQNPNTVEGEVTNAEDTTTSI